MPLEPGEGGGATPAYLRQLHDVSSLPPAIGDTIIWDGESWVPGLPEGPTPLVPPEWAPYEPALTASGVDPVLGVGGVAVGKFWQLGTFVRVEVWAKFGSSGNSVGSGEYEVSLPVPAATPLRVGGEQPIGGGWAMPIVTHYLLSVELFTTTTVVMRVSGSGELMVGPAQPAAWGPNGELVLYFSYEAAAA